MMLLVGRGWFDVCDCFVALFVRVKIFALKTPATAWLDG